jgi:hypothetical protein
MFDELSSELAEPSDESPYLSQLDLAALAARLFALGAAPQVKSRSRQVWRQPPAARDAAAKRAELAARGCRPAGSTA